MQAEMIPGSLGFVTTVRLAWLNLARNRKRTAITAVTVTMAVFVLDISMSLLMGIERQSFDNLINYQTAHAKVFSEGYYEERQEMPLDYLLTELESIQAAVRGVSGVAATTPRISFSAQLSNGAEQIPSLGTGIQIVGSDSDVFRIHEGVVEGEYLRPGQDGILLGGGLAEVFEASVGDWLTVLTKTRAGAYEAIDLPIVGLLGTGNPLIDRGSFLIPLATAQRMLAMEGTATEVAIRFSSTANESRTLERVAEALGTKVE